MGLELRRFQAHGMRLRMWRRALSQRRHRPVQVVRRDTAQHSRSQGGRPPAFDRDLYKQRNTVHQPAQAVASIATRYRRPTIYLAGLHIAGTFLWSAR
jgi:hypothetical protein